MIPFRRKQDRTILSLYGAIVAQARAPSLYRDFGVPDSVAGRIEMVMLHLALTFRRLRRANAPARLNQALFDHFCRDMDDNFREMGVGDLTVPTEMKRVGEAFYGRAKAYDEALDAGDAARLTDALRRNVFGGADAPGAAALAGYTLAADRLPGEGDPGGWRFEPPLEAAAVIGSVA